jgi:hypothetical protein
MLQDLSEAVRDCHLLATECRRIAEAASDPGTRCDFLDIERRWLRLAESWQFWEQLRASAPPDCREGDAARKQRP